MAIDLRAEQQATLARPRRKYGLLARMLFIGMDVFYGKRLTYRKLKLLETLARIPYQAWEIHEYHKLSHRFGDPVTVEHAEDIINWGRAAQDNEFWHLQAIGEKMRQEGIRPGWFRDRIAAHAAVFQYNLFCRALAFISIRTALRLNADFEDHAEHEYMQFAKDHPELDEQPVGSDVASQYGDLSTWGEVVRRIGLDEREHMNNSLIRCGLIEETAPLPPSA